MIWLLEQSMKYRVFCYQGNNVYIQDFLDIEENNLDLYIIILLLFYISYILKARHGKNHEYNPTEVNYRANIEALRGLGVTHILAATACGSLKVMYCPIVFSIIFIVDKINNQASIRSCLFSYNLNRRNYHRDTS